MIKLHLIILKIITFIDKFTDLLRDTKFMFRIVFLKLLHVMS